MRKVLFSIIFILLLSITNVNATNDVSYNLTIDKDYNFSETIDFKITDYKQKNNGNNYFADIINNPQYTDLTYKNKYKKKVVKHNGYYSVRLSNTYSEYGMGNSNFLNNCFENANFNYDLDTLSFTGSDGFICLYGDSLKISVTTPFEVTETNGIKSGNTYTWNVTNLDFSMNISMNKVYEKKAKSSSNDEQMDIDDTSDNTSSETDANNTSDSSDTENKKSINPLTIVFVIIIFVVFVLAIILLLRSKSRSVNKI